MSGYLLQHVGLHTLPHHHQCSHHQTTYWVQSKRPPVNTPLLWKALPRITSCTLHCSLCLMSANHHLSAMSLQPQVCCNLWSSKNAEAGGCDRLRLESWLRVGLRTSFETAQKWNVLYWGNKYDKGTLQYLLRYFFYHFFQLQTGPCFLRCTDTV